MTTQIPETHDPSSSFVKEIKLGTSIRKPIIAGLRGEVSHERLKVALTCLIRIASSDAKLQLGEEFITAQQGWELGLVTHICSPDDLEKVVEDKLREMAELAPLAVARVMESVDRGMELPLDQALALETELFVACFDTEDAREGPKAFLEKRKPAFRGI
jgi:enoyl-CoA hydratase/carnithine racemase